MTLELTGSEPLKLPPTLTMEHVYEAHHRRQTSLDDPGFCLSCGAEVSGVEPDACGYTCEACGEENVFGVEEIILRVVS